MGVDPLTAVLPVLGDILVECRMVVTDAQGRVIGADAARHRFTSSAAQIRDPETGAVVGAVDVAGPSHAVHPTTAALLLAAARLAEGLLRAQAAVREARDLGRRPGRRALPGRARARGRAAGLAAARVGLPTTGDRVALPDGAEAVLTPLADGWLLRPSRRGPFPCGRRHSRSGVRVGHQPFGQLGRAAQRDEVSARHFVDVDPRPFRDDPALQLDREEAVVAGGEETGGQVGPRLRPRLPNGAPDCSNSAVSASARTSAGTSWKNASMSSGSSSRRRPSRAACARRASAKPTSPHHSPPVSPARGVIALTKTISRAGRRAATNAAV